MPEKVIEMKKAHKVIAEVPFQVVDLERGYSSRYLRIDLDKNDIQILPVTDQMKELWTGGKGFDLWLMLQEIDQNTKWDSNNNPICFSSGPLGGTSSFPGSGKRSRLILICNPVGRNYPMMKQASRWGCYPVYTESLREHTEGRRDTS